MDSHSKTYWIDRIKHDADSALKEVYASEREFCLSWLARHTSLDDSKRKEVFQSAVIILYDNVITGKLVELTSKLSTYLISICRNKALESSRANGKTSYTNVFPTLVDHVSDDMELEETRSNLLSIVASKLNEMGEPCKSLLQLFYYQRMKMSDISELMGYNNANTAKNQKYKCLKRLQKLSLGHLSSKQVK